MKPTPVPQPEWAVPNAHFADFADAPAPIIRRDLPLMERISGAIINGLLILFLGTVFFGATRYALTQAERMDALCATAPGCHARHCAQDTPCNATPSPHQQERHS